MRPLLTALVAVFLCACSLTPQYCRTLGVDVQDGGVQTGVVVVEKEGCIPGYAKQLAVDKWEVCATDYWTRQHEYCHALYQRIGHGKPE